MCFARTVTQRNRYAARTAKKSGSKAAHGSDKTEQGGTLPPLANCQSERPVSARAHAATAREQERSRTPSVPKADACVARELWCFAGCLSPILPPIARHASRATCLRLQRSSGTLSARSILGGTLRMPCPANTSERPELRAVVVSAGATLRAALIYTGLATAHASATKSSSVGDSRPRTTLRPDPTHARAARR